MINYRSSKKIPFRPNFWLLLLEFNVGGFRWELLMALTFDSSLSTQCDWIINLVHFFVTFMRPPGVMLVFNAAGWQNAYNFFRTYIKISVVHNRIACSARHRKRCGRVIIIMLRFSNRSITPIAILLHCMSVKPRLHVEFGCVNVVHTETSRLFTTLSFSSDASKWVEQFGGFSFLDLERCNESQDTSILCDS